MIGWKSISICLFMMEEILIIEAISLLLIAILSLLKRKQSRDNIAYSVELRNLMNGYIEE